MKKKLSLILVIVGLAIATNSLADDGVTKYSDTQVKVQKTVVNQQVVSLVNLKRLRNVYQKQVDALQTKITEIDATIDAAIQLGVVDKAQPVDARAASADAINA